MLLRKKLSVHNCAYSQQKPNIKSVLIQSHVPGCSSRGLQSLSVQNSLSDLGQLQQSLQFPLLLGQHSQAQEFRAANTAKPSEW